MAHERAVLGGVGGRHGVRNPVAVLVPFVLVHFADGDFVAAHEIADEEIGAGILALLAAAVLRGLPGTAGARAAAGRCRTAAASRAAPAAASATAAAADSLVIREPGRRRLGQAEAADLFERLHLSVGQRHDAHAGARLSRAAGAAASALTALRGLRAGLGAGV